MTPIFADSFYFIALSNPADAHHRAAIAASDRLPSTLLTTRYVLIEVADALSKPGFRVEIARFLRRLASYSLLEIVDHDVALFDRGLDLYAARQDKEWSLTDCLSFVVMSERGLTQALTGDHHFEQAGFQALLRPATR